MQLVQEVVDCDPAKHPLLQLSGDAHSPVVKAALLQPLGHGVQQGLECDRGDGPLGFRDPLLRHLQQLNDSVSPSLGVSGEAAEAGLDLLPELVLQHKVPGERREEEGDASRTTA